ncbi:conserved hypothetical protein [Talaromyces stipitatus ATCC 10500]|uniref:Pre-rRNA-processing protein RIX1 n=1 Tax=Talaromyces stipitatus (strain ATCC 10500 / CBS 375.48 / QM 6759 / NRRL 1006) TaxID=441959 RepID=B8MBR2_TALSN|nr:uncharacterized protein TSTA_119570 [Talaromyces stipitatus ATCC 10500]EED18195.1 conserved hypothetical protein [Talaromyces stipitatus ATCC 10500]
MASSTTLRTITNRLTTTPVNELPYVAAFLASSLSDCTEFNAQPEPIKKSNADGNNGSQVNKLKARLTSLLQDRSMEGRWTAVVLIKALLEAGGWEILRDCGPWVRGLLAILSKSDPSSTKKLSIITLTRIFHLTYQYPTLVREITTPNLPGFITTSLNLIHAKKALESARTSKESSLLETVLAAFAELIGRHPTIFRPFVNQLQKFLLPILCSSTVNSSLSSRAIHLAQEVFVALHNCAPKNTSGEQWTNDCKNTISSIHQAADHVFRSVIEQWESSDPNLKPRKMSKYTSDLPRDDEQDALGLPAWQGLPAGATKIAALLNLLAQFISIRTASAINYPIGAILNLTSRLTSVTVPKTGEGQANPDFTRDERASLYMELPRIHAACIDLFRAIMSTFGSGVTPVIHTILEQTLWVFEAESFNNGIRESSYLLIGDILSLVGRSLVKQNVFALSSLVRQCCRDLVPVDTARATQDQQNTTSKGGKSKNSQLNMNVDVILNPALKESNTNKESNIGRQDSAAMALLPLLYNYLPTEFIPMPIRTEMERVTILTSNRSAMVASVMNPIPPVKGRRAIPSILPFLATRYAKELEVECLIRPRMPVLLGNTGEQYDAEDYEEQEGSMDTDVPAVPVSSVDIQQLSSNFANNVQPATVVQPPSTATQNKRILPEDSDKSGPSQAISEQSIPPQAKKARFGDGEVQVASTTPVVPVTLFEASASPAIIPPTATPVTSSIMDSSAPRYSSVSTDRKKPDGGAAAGNIDDDDSDDEMPTLNIEPDTDEDEDDE